MELHQAAMEHLHKEVDLHPLHLTGLHPSEVALGLRRLLVAMEHLHKEADRHLHRLTVHLRIALEVAFRQSVTEHLRKMVDLHHHLLTEPQQLEGDLAHHHLLPAMEHQPKEEDLDLLLLMACLRLERVLAI